MHDVIFIRKELRTCKTCLQIKLACPLKHGWCNSPSPSLPFAHISHLILMMVFENPRWITQTSIIPPDKWDNTLHFNSFFNVYWGIALGLQIKGTPVGEALSDRWHCSRWEVAHHLGCQGQAPQPSDWLIRRPPGPGATTTEPLATPRDPRKWKMSDKSTSVMAVIIIGQKIRPKLCQGEQNHKREWEKKSFELHSGNYNDHRLVEKKEWMERYKESEGGIETR